VELGRLQTANLVGQYNIRNEGCTNPSRAMLTEDERAKLFAWGLTQDRKCCANRFDRVPATNPLVISDSAREYFQYTDIVAQARAEDERAKSALTSKEEAKPVPPENSSSLARIAMIAGVGVLAVGAIYFAFRWWRQGAHSISLPHP
jgi:hypothetical protein